MLLLNEHCMYKTKCHSADSWCIPTSLSGSQPWVCPWKLCWFSSNGNKRALLQSVLSGREGTGSAFMVVLPTTIWLATDSPNVFIHFSYTLLFQENNLSVIIRWPKSIILFTMYSSQEYSNIVSLFFNPKKIWFNEFYGFLQRM